METLTDCMVNDLNAINFRTIPNGSFRISSTAKKSQTLEFFNDLYTYPPKFRVKWDSIDELHEDLFMSYNYRVLDQRLPFNEVLTDFFTKDENGTTNPAKYSLNSYIDGYLNKITSTKFYGKQVKKLQESLQNVPVYVILNGQNEIVLATSNDLNSDTPNVNSEAYNFCGSFDPLAERSSQLGLFFMSRDDAEIYLKEIAKSDTQGTKVFGLSIHCFGLDFAYRVTREYHPNIDFRFVPDLKEVQTLMTPNNTGDSRLIFEDSQQQLRFRRRSVNIIPVFNKLNKWVSPFSSFLEKTDYFKGVPIYVIQVNETPTNLISENYYKTVNIIDNFCGRIFKYLDFGIGFGNNWILQGSIQDSKMLPKSKTYVFFEKKAAIDFCQQQGRKIIRYNGSRSRIFEPLIKKPKIFVHNLEDYLEMYEDTMAKSTMVKTLPSEESNFATDQITFVASKESTLDFENYLSQNKKPALQKVSQFVNFKYRRLTGFFETLLNTN